MILLLRHGQTRWNKKGLVQGQTDIPLSFSGRRDFKESLKDLKEIPITAIISSPLKRAKQSAEILAKKLGQPKVIIDKDLIEYDFGSREGKPPHTPKTGDEEDLNLFLERILRVIIKYATMKGNYILVTHGAVIAHLIRLISKNDEYIYLENGTFTVIDSKEILDGLILELKAVNIKPGEIDKIFNG